MNFHKYHALGNDYIILDPADVPAVPAAEQIRTICHRNFGIGSDGILYGPLKTDLADFALRIFNPDGSEAEKSGNGLRIFARYLWDRKKVTKRPFRISTPGGIVTAQLVRDGSSVTVEMGKVCFNSAEIPVAGPPREVINETIEIDGRNITFCAATIGNPHCVVPSDDISEAQARRFGPVIERDSRFPNRTNVQFMKVMDRANIRIEIWERGAGYTLASGSSSCAAAAVARRLGLCDSNITVHMPGGQIEIVVSNDFSVRMTGPVTKVADGAISDEIFG